MRRIYRTGALAVPGHPVSAPLAKWWLEQLTQQKDDYTMANREQRTKITLRDIGAPASVNNPDWNEKTRILGRLSGVVDKFVKRESADKTDVFEGLGGNFRVQPVDPSFPELESGILFIPEAFHNMCAAGLRDAQKSDPNATLSFVFDVYAVRADNPAKYSWAFFPVLENKAVNPLDVLTATLPAIGARPKTAQLTDQSGERQTITAAEVGKLETVIPPKKK